MLMTEHRRPVREKLEYRVARQGAQGRRDTRLGDPEQSQIADTPESIAMPEWHGGFG